jgi:hypothetical protein
MDLGVAAVSVADHIAAGYFVSPPGRRETHRDLTAFSRGCMGRADAAATNHSTRNREPSQMRRHRDTHIWSSFLEDRDGWQPIDNAPVDEDVELLTAIRASGPQHRAG